MLADEGVEQIAEALKINSTLKELNLGNLKHENCFSQ
jgi:hypothetical protein